MSGSLMASPSSRDSELPVTLQTLSHSRTVDSDRGGHPAFALPPAPHMGTHSRTHAHHTGLCMAQMDDTRRGQALWSYEVIIFRA